MIDNRKGWCGGVRLHAVRRRSFALLVLSRISRIYLAFNPLLRYYVVATCRVPIYLPVDRNSYMNRHA